VSESTADVVVEQEVAALPTCSAAGEDCRETQCCAEEGSHCYEKDAFWASCKTSCDPAAADPLDESMWSCKVLGEVQCSASDGNCAESQCCLTPGHQCYEMNEFWAGCKAFCDPNGADDMAGKGWTCAELGKRSFGDSHAWRPCPPQDPENQYPTLATDVPGAWASAEVRARALLPTLSLKDKVALLHGQGSAYPNDRHNYAGYINPQMWVGNPCAMPLMLNDGPQGYNHYNPALAGTTTQFPSLLSVAASFDPEVARAYAAAIAVEFTQKGANVLLGPDVETMRAPLTGRSFETITGEEPYLGATLVKPFVQAITAQGIIVTAKHWLNNNEEIYRQTMSVDVSERAQHEIYMPVFKAAIEAGAGAVMCSYNKVSGTHACENPHLLKKLLREDLGFKGFVMSDWGAAHDAVKAVMSGLDIEMPGGDDDKFHTLPDLVASGEVPESAVDEMAVHVLSSMYAAGQFDGKFKFTTGDAALSTNVTSDEHRDVARKTIIDSAVLLKNDYETLPLRTAGKKIALIGRACKETTDKSYGQGDVFSGGGSGYVMSNLTISPLEGLRRHIKDAGAITWSEDASAGHGADVAIVCAAAHSEEGWDRANLSLPGAAELVTALRNQDHADAVLEMAQALAGLPAARKGGSKRIVVLAVSPGALTTEWIDQVDAALLMFMPGEQVGPAFAQLLTGEESPGGRLPISLPKVDEKRFTPEQYPGTPYNDVNMTARFSEGVLVGYRWNNAKNIPSAFPFGYGLGYTSFEFRDFEISCQGGKATVSMSVVNTGAREGVAVPQLYVSFDSLKPVVRQLRGFQKAIVPAGQQVKVDFTLGEADWSFYHEAERTWRSAVAMGETVTVHVGSSSADLTWDGQLSCL